jgi:hypothetical protein
MSYNPEKLAILVVHIRRKMKTKKSKTQHNMCGTPLIQTTQIMDFSTLHKTLNKYIRKTQRVTLN